jgi:hypothetical protein
MFPQWDNKYSTNRMLVRRLSAIFPRSQGVFRQMFDFETCALRHIHVACPALLENGPGTSADDRSGSSPGAESLQTDQEAIKCMITCTS